MTMTEVPIRRLTVSDFRSLEGTRELPLDAPVVLIHGSNGTGKTSVLSALELALTGGIRSMEKQFDSYHEHLPFFGRPASVVEVDVAEYLRANPFGGRLTVDGSGVNGSPTLANSAAKFYAERCYLDQSSLGRLLDLYQARESNGHTALEKFVNELLGLEKLDALRDGLYDATDLRLLKRLAVGVGEANDEAKKLARQLSDQGSTLSEIQEAVAEARGVARRAIEGLLGRATEVVTAEMTDENLIDFARQTLEANPTPARRDAAVTCHQDLLALSGRISALTGRPSRQRITETRKALADATAAKEEWEATDGSTVRAWEAEAESTGVDLRGQHRIAVENARSVALRDLEEASSARAQTESAYGQLEADRAELDMLQSKLRDAHEDSSILVEGLASLRTVIGDSDACPVCDRDFTEVHGHSLSSHVDAKLTALATHGGRLVELRNERDQLAARVSRAEEKYNQLAARIIPIDQEQALNQRCTRLAELHKKVGQIEAAHSEGRTLSSHVKNLAITLDDMESVDSEERHIASEIAKYAAILEVDLSGSSDSFQSAATELLSRAELELSSIDDLNLRRKKASDEAARLESLLEKEVSAGRRLFEISASKDVWDDRLAEARRRQGVANQVRAAATKARKNIVHRVFNESLNDVWEDVFSRLAPDEDFIPSFGMPNATKNAFDIKLQTTHKSGESSGPPQMMLSAGNLNTAALSLFLALHLAVEPEVPCLVFDDPVQAMDEVHVSQFAALVRLLSKQHDRQVIIAVHERELFDYLALELSPAYPGDELITIELGDRATDDDAGVTRHAWHEDIAIAN